MQLRSYMEGAEQSRYKRLEQAGLNSNTRESKVRHTDSLADGIYKFIRLRRKPRVYPWMNAKTVLRRDVTLHVSADNLAEVPTDIGTQADNKRYHRLARGVP